MRNSFNDLPPSERKALFEYDEKRCASKLSKDLLAMSNLFQDCFNELVAMLGIDDNDERNERVQILNERVEYLTSTMYEKSEELIFISDQIKRIL